MLRPFHQRLGLSALLLGASMAVATAQTAPASTPNCAVTFKIHVPKTSGTVYLSGNIPALGPWADNKVALTGTGLVRATVVKIPEGTHLEFKFTRGAWTSVETTAAGKDVANRTYTVPSTTKATYTGTVLGWHDTAGK